MIFELRGTPSQQALVERALARCDYPFDRLAAGLAAQAGRSVIPVEWTDLSAYGARGHGDIEAHVLFRERVLGLAWYEGRISIEQSLEAQPELAQEVFLAEAAHMVDFFALTDEQRAAIVRAYHGEALDAHGWFDVGGYGEWVGEAWMAGFTLAFSDVVPTLGGMAHATVDPAELRRIAMGRVYFARQRSSVFHDTHARINPEIVWAHRDDAGNSGRRPCRVCKP